MEGSGYILIWVVVPRFKGTFSSGIPCIVGFTRVIVCLSSNNDFVNSLIIQLKESGFCCRIYRAPIKPLFMPMIWQYEVSESILWMEPWTLCSGMGVLGGTSLMPKK